MNRGFTAAAAVCAVPLGLWLRFKLAGPEWLRDASGGVLYVLFFMLVLAFFRPRMGAARIAIAIFLATCCVEFSQALHLQWLIALRRTIPGRLVLGTTFNWADFPPYAAGALIGWGFLTSLRRRGTPSRAAGRRPSHA